MKQPFPFSAIVGQEDMKRAMILTAIDPLIGGVLVFGDRGDWQIDGRSGAGCLAASAHGGAGLPGELGIPRISA